MGACNCNITLHNTGTPNCPNIFDVPYKYIFTSYYTSSGAVNEIDINTTLDQAYFIALVKNSNANLKWFPTPQVDNVVNEREESVYETLASGKKVFIREGFRSITADWINYDTIFLGKIKNLRCKDLGVYVIDKQGNLIGMTGSTNSKLAPIKLDKDTVESMFKFASYETSQKIGISMQIDASETDENLRMVKASELTSYDLKGLNGLIDIVPLVPTSITTTGFTMVLNTYYGTPLNPIKATGLSISDFVLYNNTTTSNVTIATLTETNGSYTFTFTAQASNDVLKLSLASSVIGYDDSLLQNNLITIP